MIKAKALKQARESHINEINKTVDHLRGCKHLKIERVTIDISNKKSIKESIKALELYKSKGIYGFFVDKKSIPALRVQLEEYRKVNRASSIEKRQAVPYPNMLNAAKDGCLYIGMVREKNLESRILEHLTGTKSPRTGALKMHIWAKGLKQISISYIKFTEPNEHCFIAEYEKALWKYYSPAVGKL